MINCPKCGTAVREEKAFCQNCGTPMNAARAVRETPLPDFGATVRVPPPHPAPQQFFPPPPVNEVQTPGSASVPVSPSPANYPLPAPQGAPPGQRKSARKIGVGFILLLLFLMFLAFVLAVLID